VLFLAGGKRLAALPPTHPIEGRGNGRKEPRKKKSRVSFLKGARTTFWRKKKGWGKSHQSCLGEKRKREGGAKIEFKKNEE